MKKFLIKIMFGFLLFWCLWTSFAYNLNTEDFSISKELANRLLDKSHTQEISMTTIFLALDHLSTTYKEENPRYSLIFTSTKEILSLAWNTNHIFEEQSIKSYPQIFNDEYPLDKTSDFVSWSKYHVCHQTDVDACLTVVKYDGTIGQYLWHHVQAHEDRWATPSEPDPQFVYEYPTSRQTWQYVIVYESRYYFLSGMDSILVVPINDQSTDILVWDAIGIKPQTVLSFIDFDTDKE
jgi:hypothetical protein